MSCGLQATIRVLLAVLLLAFPVLAGSAAAAPMLALNGTGTAVQCETCPTPRHGSASDEAPGASQHSGDLLGCLGCHGSTLSSWLPAPTTAGISPSSASAVFVWHSIAGRVGLVFAPSTPPPRSVV